MTHDQYRFNRCLLKRGVDIAFQRDRFAAAQAFIGANHPVARAILYPSGNCLWRKSAKYHAMHRANPRAGQHGKRACGDHRHVNGHAVAALHAHFFQAVGHADDFGLQYGVADMAHFTASIIGFKNQRGNIAIARQHMPIDCIVTNVEYAVLEPFDLHRIKTPSGDFGRRCYPVNPFGLVCPKTIGVRQALCIHRVILLCRTIGPRDCGGWRRQEIGGSG